MPDKQYPPYSGPKTPYAGVPINFAGVEGNSRFSIHTEKGAKWMQLGQEANGYLISGYNPQSRELQLTKDGRHYMVPMNPQTVKAAEPTVSPYTNDPTADMMGDSAMTNSENEQMGEDLNMYKFDPAEFDQIWNNAQQSTYMDDRQKGSIYSLEEFQKRRDAGELTPNEPYYVPKRLEDGTVDFDIFTFRNEADESDPREAGTLSNTEQELLADPAFKARAKKRDTGPTFYQ